MYVKVFYSKKETFLFAIEEIKEKLKDDFDYFIFAISPKFNTKINTAIKKIFKTNNYIAFHSVDSFADNNIIRDGVTVLAIKFERNGKISKFVIDDIDDKSSLRAAEYFNNNQDKFHLLFAAYSEGEINSFIEKISQNINYNVNNIAGGVASGIEKNGKWVLNIFTDDLVIEKGLVILSFENVNANIGVSSGFKPYGITYKITKAKKNRIYMVDDGKNFSYLIKKLFTNIEKPDIRYLWYTPIFVLNNENSYVYATRTIKEITDDYVEFFANVEEEKYFKISFATYKELLQEDKRVACELIKKCDDPEICFNFSCIARQYVLEDKQEEENIVYTSTFNTHLFGFFTFGEIGPDIKKEKLIFYNETSLPVILKEKE
jgi:hypothetical protein